VILANSLSSDARHSSSRGGRLGDTNRLRWLRRMNAWSRCRSRHLPISCSSVRSGHTAWSYSRRVFRMFSVRQVWIFIAVDAKFHHTHIGYTLWARRETALSALHSSRTLELHLRHCGAASHLRECDELVPDLAEIVTITTEIREMVQQRLRRWMYLDT